MREEWDKYHELKIEIKRGKEGRKKETKKNQYKQKPKV